jgi:hypothetical protein
MANNHIKPGGPRAAKRTTAKQQPAPLDNLPPPVGALTLGEPLGQDNHRGEEANLTTSPEQPAPADRSGVMANARPSVRLSLLDSEALQYLGEREAIVSARVTASIAAARALHDINNYRNGVLWKRKHRTFAAYMQDRWDFQKTHGCRLADAGKFLAAIGSGFSPNRENLPVSEGQIRPILEMVPAKYHVECWVAITDGKVPAELSMAAVAAEAEKFLRAKGVAPRCSKRAKIDERKCAVRDLAKLSSSLGKLSHPERFEDLLQSISTLISQEPSDRITPALPMSDADVSKFMSARLLHAALFQGGDYPQWLTETAGAHPADVHIPHDKRDSRISLFRARFLAFMCKSRTSVATFKLIAKAELSGNGNPGATADALFLDYAQRASSSSPGLADPDVVCSPAPASGRRQLN